LSTGPQTDGNRSRGCGGTAAALCGVFLSGLFLLNLTAGIVEIPDNLPLVGNLDEVLASTLLLACLRYLGLDVTALGRRPPVTVDGPPRDE